MQDRENDGTIQETPTQEGTLSASASEHEVKSAFKEMVAPLSIEDTAKKAVSSVFREETTSILSQCVGITKSKLGLIEKLFERYHLLDESVFGNPQNLVNMTTREKVFAMRMILSAIGALTMPIDEQKALVNEMQTQINIMIEKENQFVGMSVQKKGKLRNVIEMFLAKLANGESDVDLLNESAVAQNYEHSRWIDAKTKKEDVKK